MHERRFRPPREVSGETRQIPALDRLAARAATAAALASARLGRRRFTLVDLGRSGAIVARIAGGLFLKLAAGESIGATALVEREARVLAWLEGKARVPSVVWAGDCDDRFALITERLPGTPVSEVPPPQAREALAAAVAAMAALHALDAADCPFDARLAGRLAEARARVAAGAVDETDFDAERRGWSAARALAQAIRDAPAEAELALTHGDASLPNFLWTPGEPAGLVDLGRFGLSDRSRDLALFLRSAKRNHPAVDARAVLGEQYPQARLDERLLAYYRLLDEFF